MGKMIFRMQGKDIPYSLLTRVNRYKLASPHTFFTLHFLHCKVSHCPSLNAYFHFSPLGKIACGRSTLIVIDPPHAILRETHFPVPF